ncbi:MAG: ABC transporter substrate-binding protein [Burkholderiales bacterium]|nr:ABC transporter substrate-binding protein [Burkholderiales bacterium]
MLAMAPVALLGHPPAARAADPLVIGQVAPFTGSQAVTGQAIHSGIELCIDAANTHGGVHGRELKLVTRDDAQKPDETVRLTRELIAGDAPVAMLGTVGTDNLEALARDGVLEQAHVSMVGAVSGAASLAKAKDLYPVKARYRDEIARLFSQISFLGVTQVALLYQDDSLGRDVLAGADAAAKRYGVTLLVRSGYQRNTTAVAKAVAEIAKVRPQVVFLGATTAAAIEFVKEYAAAKGTGTLYGMSIIDSEALLKGLGPERSRGYAFSVVLPLATQTQVAVVREYLQLRQASADAHLSARSIEGFIACKALVKVLESTPDPTPIKVTAALARAKAVDVGNYVLDFAAKEHGVSSYVDFAMFGADGKVVQ